MLQQEDKEIGDICWDVLKIARYLLEIKLKVLFLCLWLNSPALRFRTMEPEQVKAKPQKLPGVHWA